MSYLRLVQTLNIKLPLIDPAHYIHRFTALLEFGDETGKVATDAVRLVQRFNRDWMTAGRRPAGICGACILLAARMNNFRRSVQEVVQVVKIADVTLKKRLDEFKKTSSGNLTVTDFRRVWLEEEMDPPAFTKGKEKEKTKLKVTVSKKKKRKRGEDSEESSDESSQDAEGNDPPCAPGASDVPAVNAELFTQGILAGALDSTEESHGSQLFLPDPDEDRLQDGTQERQDDDKGDYDTKDDYDVGRHGPGDSAIDPRLLHISRSEAIKGPGTPSQMLPPVSPLDATFDSFLTEEVSQFIENEQGSLLAEALDTAERRRWSSISTVDDLHGLDEEELDRMILSEEEVKIKERIWVELNREYLENLAGVSNPTSFFVSHLSSHSSHVEAKAIREQNGESSNPKTRKVCVLQARLLLFLPR
jgi:transcription factor IIIB 90 kDa subunit